eukprot:365995-Chlamydomonas_euryale.AAC.4
MVEAREVASESELQGAHPKRVRLCGANANGHHQRRQEAQQNQRKASMVGVSTRTEAQAPHEHVRQRTSGNSPRSTPGKGTTHGAAQCTTVMPVQTHASPCHAQLRIQ